MNLSNADQTQPKAISIIGSGYTGTTVGEGLRSLGYDVIFYDIEQKQLPNFTHDLDRAIHNSSVSIICVPTPTSLGGGIDLSCIVDSVIELGKSLQNKNGYHLLVVKSTVVPTTTETIIIPELEKACAKKAGLDFGVCVNPEFMTEMSRTWSDDESFIKTFFNDNHIIIGEYDKRSGDILEEIYKPLRIPIQRVDMRTAEMIKYAANCMLATKISYWNEIFLICDKMGIDAQRVADIVSGDHRIGKYGTVLGKAFGGKCLPKDLDAFIETASIYHNPVLLPSVKAINETMQQKYGVRQ